MSATVRPRYSVSTAASDWSSRSRISSITVALRCNWALSASALVGMSFPSGARARCHASCGRPLRSNIAIGRRFPGSPRPAGRSPLPRQKLRVSRPEVFGVLGKSCGRAIVAFAPVPISGDAPLTPAIRAFLDELQQLLDGEDWPQLAHDRVSTTVVHGGAHVELRALERSEPWRRTDRSAITRSTSRTGPSTSASAGPMKRSASCRCSGTGASSWSSHATRYGRRCAVTATARVAVPPVRPPVGEFPVRHGAPALRLPLTVSATRTRGVGYDVGCRSRHSSCAYA